VVTAGLQAGRIDTNGNSKSADRAALFVVRAWHEEGSTKPLRVHLRQTHDVDHGFESVLTLADIEEACTVLRGWLESFLAGRPAQAAGGTGE